MVIIKNTTAEHAPAAQAIPLEMENTNSLNEAHFILVYLHHFCIYWCDDAVAQPPGDRQQSTSRSLSIAPYPAHKLSAL
jgi:hypothetical protein